MAGASLVQRQPLWWRPHLEGYNQFIENCFSLLPRQALHARSLGFVHPTTGKEVYFESELPEDLKSVIAKWEGYVAARKLEEE